ncbi:MAG TPA: hypothetical protein VFA45_23090, partial [Actinomycetes bacterium]|nr:hypothetical protein [Actinomycetes bacterium]
KGVRSLVVRTMSYQAEGARAIEFLTSVAKDERPEYRGEHWPPPYLAVATLGIMGPQGQAALQRLHTAGEVVNSRARGYLDYISGHSYKDPSMK